MPQRKMTAHEFVKDSDERSELWVKHEYITQETADRFDAWSAEFDVSSAWPILLSLLEEGYGVSIKAKGESWVCTVSSESRRVAGKPCLLSGWGPDAFTCLLVAKWKHEVLLDKDWDSFQEAKPRRRIW